MTGPTTDAYGLGGHMGGAPGTVPLDGLRSFLAALFEAAGYRSPDAELVADSLSDADARGIASHGTIRTRVYIDRARHGLVDVAAVPAVSGSGPCATVDARNAPGHVAALAGMRTAVERARRHGIGAAGVHSSNHCGTLATSCARSPAPGWCASPRRTDPR